MEDKECYSPEEVGEMIKAYEEIVLDIIGPQEMNPNIEEGIKKI